MMNNQSLYDKDFYAWALRTAKLLRQGKFEELDVENIAEEIESRGRSDKRQIISRFIMLILHLLKWQFQPEKRGSSWKGTILHQRIKIAFLLKDSPSLNYELPRMFEEAYTPAILKASVETELAKDVFPAVCPFSLKQCLDDGFFPS